MRTTLHRLQFSLTACLLALLAVGCAPRSTDSWPARTDSLVARQVEIRLNADPGMDRAVPWLKPVDRTIQSFYEANSYRPAWIDDGKVTRLARTLLEDLERVGEDGIPPEIFAVERVEQAIARLEEEKSPESAALADLELTRAFLHYATVQTEGLVDPRQVGSEAYVDPEEAPLDSLLTVVLSGRAPDRIRDLVAPRSPLYEALFEARREYLELAERADWPQLPDTVVVEPGEAHSVVPLLRQRLAITGELDRSGSERDTVFDGEVQAAVARFQRRHAIAVDSTLGPQTLAALNRTPGEIVKTIEMAMERLRWMPSRLGDRFVLVNIPEFQVYGYEAGEPVLEMNVVVGAEYGGRQTPVFHDVMEHVVFNPYWNVPSSITVNELLPKIRENPGYLAANRYELVDGEGQVVQSANPDAIEDGEYRIRQRPGSDNALGLVKYMFPNQYDIYLHDTPADHLFQEFERDFSHGCIRLEHPDVFGEFVLGPQGWDEVDVRSAIEAGEHRTVMLEEQFPVYILYLTAFFDGRDLILAPDIYGYDSELESALAAQRNRVSG